MFFLRHFLWQYFAEAIILSDVNYILTVFQLGLFLRALRPARTGLRPARFTCALPEFRKKKKNYKKKKLFLQNVIAVFVFSDSRCKNACRFVPMFSSIGHKTKFWSFTHTKFCVVCALNCAQILVVRALNCAQFILHPAFFPTWLEHCYCSCKNQVFTFIFILKPLHSNGDKWQHMLLYI